MSRLQDRVALVTGAGQGIGRSFAERFVAEGAADKIVAGGGRARAAAVDVTDPDGVAQVVAETVDAWGHLDVLVNNAATFSTITMKPFDEIDLTEWEAVVRAT